MMRLAKVYLALLALVNFVDQLYLEVILFDDIVRGKMSCIEIGGVVTGCVMKWRR